MHALNQIAVTIGWNVLLAFVVYAAALQAFTAALRAALKRSERTKWLAGGDGAVIITVLTGALTGPAIWPRLMPLLLPGSKEGMTLGVAIMLGVGSAMMATTLYPVVTKRVVTLISSRQPKE